MAGLQEVKGYVIENFGDGDESMDFIISVVGRLENFKPERKRYDLT